MLLEIKNLSVCLKNLHQDVPILRDVSLNIGKGRLVGLVGGSGSGKTTTGLAVLRLLAPELVVTGGDILMNGDDVLAKSPQQLQSMRGRVISMVFQEPLLAFNPVFTIGSQVEEVYRFHARLDLRQRREQTLELLNEVGIPEPKRVADSYPHQLSGGLRQRAMIAQAVAARPQLIIADEPTSNMDVTLQARIIELFEKLRQDFQLSILLITHDLGVVRFLTDEVAVMQRGRIVESGKTAQVLGDPRHEYTQQLLKALEA